MPGQQSAPLLHELFEDFQRFRVDRFVMKVEDYGFEPRKVHTDQIVHT